MAAKSGQDSATTSDRKVLPRYRLGENPIETTLRRIYNKPGLRNIYGVFTTKVDPLSESGKLTSFEDYLSATEFERSKAREEAAAKMVNIDMNERDRRKLGGAIFLAAAVLVGAGLVYAEANWVVRSAVVGPLVFLGIALYWSGRAGLCNLAQAGMWDVDGAGVSEIEDKELAARMKAKVNKFNLRVGLVATAVTAAFAAIPLS